MFTAVVADELGVYAIRVDPSGSTLVTVRSDGTALPLAQGRELGPLALDAHWVYFATAPGTTQTVQRVAR
jgi:hypothetical protein